MPSVFVFLPLTFSAASSMLPLLPKSEGGLAAVEGFRGGDNEASPREYANQKIKLVPSVRPAIMPALQSDVINGGCWF
jgi:hypothetical protein